MEEMEKQPLVSSEAEVSADEQQELEALESTIGNHLTSFLEVGAALLRIREAKLYRGTYATFDEYCRRKWEISRGRAYQLMSSSQVQENLCTVVDSPDLLNEAQLRPLSKLPSDMQKIAWTRAVRKANGGKITGEHTRRAVQEILAKEPNEEKKPAKLSDEFKQGFDLFVEEIRNAKSAGWETTSREEALRHVTLLRKEIV